MTTDNRLFLREDDLDEAILAIERTQRLMAADVAAELERLELGATHDLVLRLVARRPGVSMADLVRLAASTKQTLSRVLGELEARGLVTLTSGNADRRQRLARITDEGTALLLDLNQLRWRRLRRAFKTAGPQAVGGFREVLDALLDPPAERGLASPLRRAVR